MTPLSVVLTIATAFTGRTRYCAWGIVQKQRSSISALECWHLASSSAASNYGPE
jgi:hypothetical protein